MYKTQLWQYVRISTGTPLNDDGFFEWLRLSQLKEEEDAHA